jgi:peroxiredoxin
MKSRALGGKQAPDFALDSVDGRIVHLSDFHGKAVLLHFWATSWLPCRVEMQWFEQMHNQYGPQGLQVLGIAMDNADKKDIAEFARNLASTIRFCSERRTRAILMEASECCLSRSTLVAMEKSLRRYSE